MKTNSPDITRIIKIKKAQEVLAYTVLDKPFDSKAPPSLATWRWQGYV